MLLSPFDGLKINRNLMLKISLSKDYYYIYKNYLDVHVILKWNILNVTIKDISIDFHHIGKSNTSQNELTVKSKNFEKKYFI